MKPRVPFECIILNICLCYSKIMVDMSFIADALKTELYSVIKYDSLLRGCIVPELIKGN